MRLRRTKEDPCQGIRESILKLRQENERYRNLIDLELEIPPALPYPLTLDGMSEARLIEKRKREEETLESNRAQYEKLVQERPRRIRKLRKALTRILERHSKLAAEDIGQAVVEYSDTTWRVTEINRSLERYCELAGEEYQRTEWDSEWAQKQKLNVGNHQAIKEALIRQALEKLGHKKASRREIQKWGQEVILVTSGIREQDSESIFKKDEDVYLIPQILLSVSRWHGRDVLHTRGMSPAEVETTCKLYSTYGTLKKAARAAKRLEGQA